MPGQFMSRIKLILILGCFLFPLLIATVWLHFVRASGGELGMSARGELIRPAVPLTAFAVAEADGNTFDEESLQGIWTMLYAPAGECGEVCTQNIYHMRQVRLSLGHRMDRVQRAIALEDARNTLARLSRNYQAQGCVAACVYCHRRDGTCGTGYGTSARDSLWHRRYRYGGRVSVVFVNTLTAVLTFFSLIGYAIVYTVYLKRATPQNIVIGGAAGAMPPVLGWAAITGEVTAEPLLLFLIVFIWTPPHFWALAIHRRDDYAKVDIPMLPVTHGIPFTRIQIVLYTVLLIIISVFPYLIHMSGLLYLVAAVVLGVVFLYHTIKMFDNTLEKQPIKTFVFSIQYLMWLFGAMLVDHYLPLVLALF